MKKYPILILVFAIGLSFIIPSKIYAQQDVYDAILADYFKEKSTGGTAIITKGDKVLYLGAAGMANLELNVPMKPEHVFRLGSITKQFTATAIMKLQEDGKLNIEDPITKYLPEYPLGERVVTVRQLLNHTSGIKSYTNIPGFMENETRKAFTVSELIDTFKDLPFDFEPGFAWNYNNSGYILLGAIIEAASGKTYEEYLQEAIFDPIGMTNTYYDDHRKIIKNRVPGYMPSENGVTNTEFLDMTIPYAAGSLISNVEDLAKWNKAVFDKKVVSEASLEAIFEPTPLGNGDTMTYGFGWGLDKLKGSTIYEHGGGIHGFLTAGQYAPEEDIYVAVLSNCNCVSPSDAATRLMAHALGKSLEKGAPVVLTETEAKKYTGTFKDEKSEAMRFIEWKDGSLTSQRDGGPIYKITLYENGKFGLEGSLSELEFVEEGGKITGHYLHETSGAKHFARKISDAVEKPEIMVISEEILQRYEGTFKADMGLVIHIKVKDGNLVGAPEGQQEVVLNPVSETKFTIPAFGVTLDFKMDKDGNYTIMSFAQGNTVMDMQKQ